MKEEAGLQTTSLQNHFLGPTILTPSSIASLTPSSAGINFSHFPVPPPLLPIPGITSQYPKSPFLAAHANGFPTPPTDLHSPGYPWASPTLTAMGLLPTFSPLPTSTLPFTPHTSSLLSPSPSYHSSSNSSREDLPGSGKTSLTAPTPRYGPVPSLERAKSPTPSSPLQSPLLRPHGTAWPMPVWQCFMSGTQVKIC